MTVADTRSARYRTLSPERPAAELEEEMLARWRDEDLFARTLAAREGGEPFVFFEGPPTANGRPGIHHVFSRTVKDLFCRHRAMRGHWVLRKAGWDTHGLPVEIEVEKGLARRLHEERGLSEEEASKISGKQLIEAFGVEEFNRLCRESVWRYRADWERLSERIGYWLDYSDPYVTYSNDYVESVWWALSTLHGRGLLYQGYKILPYCSRCGTALSSHEVAQGYEDVRDPSVFVALDLVREEGEGRGRDAGSESSSSSLDSLPRRRILVWTTTPWTLVSNVALAVNPELEYVELRKRTGAEWTILLAEARAGSVLGDDFVDRWEVVARMTGAELAGRRYRRPLDWVAFDASTGERDQVIVAESFVSADDGTGVVHMAPAFGADDYAAGQRHGLRFVQPVNARGEFPAEMPVVGGRFVKDADPLIIEELERRDVLWKAGTIEHAYPHCWRCGTPLLYYARASWFVRTTAYRDQLLARNARVDWHPEEIGEKRFGEWLKNNIDWAVSRDRYWGTPLPIWRCEANPDHVEVLGSFAALAERVGRDLGEDFDPHKPFIDRYEWPCEKCSVEGRAASGEGRGAGVAETSSGHSGEASRAPRPSPLAPRMKRVPEVIDAWFDSGSMPFAQWHYPFERQEMLERQYPADLVAEGLDQTRGWFYSMLAIAAGLGDALPNNGEAGAGVRRATEREDARHPTPGSIAAPYRAVVVNDLVLDADGVKMSKSRGNVVDPWVVVPRYGADAVRLFFIASSQVWVPRRLDEGAIRELAGRFLLTFKNIYSGIFAVYANFGWAPSELDPPLVARPALDRWVTSRLATVEREVDESLGRYDATAAARQLMTFLVDDVSNWYVRLNRARFYDVNGDDNRAAFATLHEVLVVSCRLLAPFAPFVSDWIHRELTGESVHLADYVRPDVPDVDPALERAMTEIRALSTLGRAAREEAGVRVRQPLSRMVCVVPQALADDVAALLPLLRSELNLKEVVLASSADALVTLEAKPNFRTLGKKFGKDTPLAAQAVAALSSDALRALERGEPVAVTAGGETRQLDAEDVTVLRRASGSLVVKEEGGRFAAIDPSITADLRQEGLARELVSRVQRMRKEAGLAVSDRIHLHVSGNSEIEAAVRGYQGWIADEVLARQITVGSEGPGESHAAPTVDLDGLTVRVAITRVE